MMRTIVLALALSSSAALVCEDLPSCDGCVAKRVDENAPSCKAWGPKKCTRKDNKNKWEAEWCPGDPCEEFPECDCVGEKANGARKCLTQTRDEAQCDRKEANANNPWVTTSWCASTDPATAQPTVTPPVTNPPTADIVNCFQDPNKDCGECCPACTAVDSVAEAFYGGGSESPFPALPNVATKCICLDLDESGYYGGIYLTPLSDCARITGDRNRVFGEGGNDAMYADGEFNGLNGGDGDDALYTWGDYNFLNGGDGDDALYTNGDYNYLYGEGGNDAMYADGEFNGLYGGDGDDALYTWGERNYLIGDNGDGDVCTDLSGSGNYIYDSCEDRRKLTDTPKLTHTAAGTKAPAARA